MRTDLLAVLGLAGLSLSSCSGPQPLSRAIDPAGEQAYLGMFSGPAETPREAFLRHRAAERSCSIDEAARLDAALSTTKNPFSARTQQDAVSAGAILYKYECLSCHGEAVDGHGPAMPVTLPEMNFHRFGVRFAVTVHGGAPKSWFKAIANGTEIEAVGDDGTTHALVMPAYEERLAREQIWLLVTYLQSLDADLDESR